MEHGKDVLAISPRGEICAYQLKGATNGKIKLKDWQQEIIGQITQLAVTPVEHPSLPNDHDHHYSYLVTNGEIEEEVTSAINSFNSKWIINGFPQYKINTIVKGQMLSDLLELKQDFIPSEFKDLNTLLEFYLQDGLGNLNKSKFSGLIESVFLSKSFKKSELNRAISSGALLCSLATSSYRNKENHYAEIEAWTIYLSYLLHVVSKNELNERYWKNEFFIAETIIINAIEELLNEVQRKENLLIQDDISDAFVVRPRATLMIGLLSSLAIYYMLKGDGNKKEVDMIDKFCNKYSKNIQIWGEGAIPQTLAFYWYSKIKSSSGDSIYFISSLVKAIINSSRTGNFLHDPHISYEDVVRKNIDIDKKSNKGSLLRYQSYVLDSLISLLVKANLKQEVKSLWPELSKFSFIKFIPENVEDFFLWNIPIGKEMSIINPKTQSWNKLKSDLQIKDKNNIPPILEKQPWLVPIFLIVFPHRLNSDLVIWFDNYLSESVKNKFYKF